jgi:NADPH-ferrihemoprotein reductase
MNVSRHKMVGPFHVLMAAYQVMEETLAALGAKRIGALGLGDESSGATEENFMDWKEDVLEELGSEITLVERPITYEPNIEIFNACIDQHHVYHGEPSETALYNTQERVAYNARNPYAAPIALTRTLSAVPNRSCVHLEFNLHAVPAMRYQTGDHLAVWPVNPDNEVDRLFRLLGVDDSQKRAPITIEATAGAARKPHLPSPTTREALLKYYLEIGGLASRDCLLLLSQYAPTEAAKETLIRLGKDKSAFRNEVAARYLSVGRVLEMVEPRHKWTKVPFAMLIESFSRLQPRRYSISSSPLVKPRQPAITMIVNNRQFQAREDAQEEGNFLGLATNFLLAHDRNLALQQKEAAGQFQDKSEARIDYDLDGPRKKLAGGKVYIHIKRSTFKLPTKATTPIIMVGAGTGIAPFRGFVQERARLMELGKPIGQMVLFFGCRNEESDYLYRDEWKAYQEQLGDKLVIIPAFSRQKGTKKTYVQDAMYRRKELVAQLVCEMNAAFYICGAAAMARDVRGRLVDILAECGGKSKKEVDAYISGTMKKAALYHEDVWGN